MIIFYDYLYSCFTSRRLLVPDMRKILGSWKYGTSSVSLGFSDCPGAITDTWSVPLLLRRLGTLRVSNIMLILHENLDVFLLIN